ncbi:MAG: hypothetical protein ISS70_06640 [Phycisphaerae bacterium]|nr:hypothetical protein [Phycisphaerae bacterium]
MWCYAALSKLTYITKRRLQFVVVGQKDMIILKTIAAPAMHEFDGLIKQAHKQAKTTGLKRSDISQAVTEARKS